MPRGLLAGLTGSTAEDVAEHARERSMTERAAVNAVLAIERRPWPRAVEMPPNNKGYDIESKAADGELLFIEVKGRIAGADTFIVTRSEIGVGRNKPGEHILALAEVPDTAPPACPVHPAGVRGRRRPPLRHHKRQPSVEALLDRGEVP